MLYEISLISIILAFAAAIQSIVGFGLALFAVPLLLLADVPLLQAVFVVLSISCVSALLGIRRLQDSFDVKKSAVASIYRALGIIPGLAAALYTANSSPATLKAAVGLAVGLGVLAQSRRFVGSSSDRRQSGADLGCEDEDYEIAPSKKAEPWAFLSSGFLMGWLGMGGPPLIFWLLTGRQSAKTSRSFLFGVYVFTIPFQLLLMAYFSPDLLSRSLPVLAIAIPLCLGVTALTLRIGDKLDVDRLQFLSLVLLSVLALKALLDWFHHVTVGGI